MRAKFRSGVPDARGDTSEHDDECDPEDDSVAEQTNPFSNRSLDAPYDPLHADVSGPISLCETSGLFELGEDQAPCDPAPPNYLADEALSSQAQALAARLLADFEYAAVQRYGTQHQ